MTPVSQGKKNSGFLVAPKQKMNKKRPHKLHPPGPTFIPTPALALGLGVSTVSVVSGAISGSASTETWGWLGLV